MPGRDDIRSILVIGSGPIVIGQGCEFDYSGTQAIRALRAEGRRVVLINSNPATIMTDPDLADATYVEPLTVEACTRVIERERPDALLPTLGGQTALNLAVALDDAGVLDRFGVETIGVGREAIRRAEDRSGFKALCEEAGLPTPASRVVRSMDEARRVLDELGLPVIVRPSFTLGGSGGGMARTREDFERIVASGLRRSPVTEVLLEESIEGWKEFELEVMRDGAGNAIVVCGIENVDPMGVHTGDSVTVAPVLTLRDVEYQAMRDMALAIVERVGIAGGANVQFALDPETGRIVVIEMNPRVSRSSALASKATGYPIAKVAARLALGFTLDELPNDVVGSVPAAFEPTVDYVVVKVPRWNFEKFDGVDDTLGPQMQSIGEVMALGRTFPEALQKAMRSLERDLAGLDDAPATAGHARTGRTARSVGTSGAHDAGGTGGDVDSDELRRRLDTPSPARLFAVKAALRSGVSPGAVAELTRIDRWFIDRIAEIVEVESRVEAAGPRCDARLLAEAKRFGLSDRRIAELWGVDEDAVRVIRQRDGIRPVVRMVDTCAGEFAARTPYWYVAYDGVADGPEADRVADGPEADRVADGPRPGRVPDVTGTGRAEAAGARPRRVMILGSGPNRIGQGIEFDYCCVHAALALREAGVTSIMVNCNPETVSTDFDVSDRLYFEPVDYEHVMAIVEAERPDGVVFQFGGQTPLKLLHRLARAGVRVLGTGVEAVDRAEDRERCSAMLDALGILHPECAFARSRDEALAVARRIGYPVLLRPPYVLGGRAMEMVRDDAELLACVDEALRSTDRGALMIDKFIEGAVEVDVDCVSDGRRVVIAGVMEHIEEAGIHSGDSACVTPPLALEAEIVEAICEATRRIALELGVVGMMNVQYAVKDNRVYCLEVNPRASRTVPYVSKATGTPWVRVAMRALLGGSIDDVPDGATTLDAMTTPRMAVKAPVLPFDRFPGVDTLLGPEMRSTGEVMGVGRSFDEAFIKAQLAVGFDLPEGAGVFVSVANRYKRKVIFPVKALHAMGYRIVATPGMARMLRSHGIAAEVVHKLSEGDPGIIERIDNGSIALVVNMAFSRRSIEDDRMIRLAASRMRVPCITTLSGFHALVLGLQALREQGLRVESLQAMHAEGAGVDAGVAVAARVGTGAGIGTLSVDPLPGQSPRGRAGEAGA